MVRLTRAKEGVQWATRNPQFVASCATCSERPHGVVGGHAENQRRWKNRRQKLATNLQPESVRRKRSPLFLWRWSVQSLLPHRLLHLRTGCRLRLRSHGRLSLLPHIPVVFLSSVYSIKIVSRRRGRLSWIRIRLLHRFISSYSRWRGCLSWVRNDRLHQFSNS
jgi:hypothetical protein